MEMSRLRTHRHTDRHVNIELEFCETEFAIIMIKVLPDADDGLQETQQWFH